MNMMTPEGKLIPLPKHDRVIIREDGRVERICDHGVGHPIGHVQVWQGWMGVHGCEGCCLKEGFDQCLTDHQRAGDAPSTPSQPGSCDPSEVPTESSC